MITLQTDSDSLVYHMWPKHKFNGKEIKNKNQPVQGRKSEKSYQNRLCWKVIWNK